MVDTDTRPEIVILCAPVSAGNVFTSSEWTAEVDECSHAADFRTFGSRSARAPTRAMALAELKAMLRREGYAGTFRHYTDVWRHF